MSSKIQKITLPSSRKTEWKKALPGLLNNLIPGTAELDCSDWALGSSQLLELIVSIEKAGFKVSIISSQTPETLVTASSLGYQTHLRLQEKEFEESNLYGSPSLTKPPKLLFHHGTLRSGDHLSTEGDLLLFGDVNPGATISAGGDVMIWGRLRGTAHAGKDGLSTSKIVALQLRPLQLRIGNLVARGPEEQPEPGLAEEAKVLNGQIVIQPACTKNSLLNKHVESAENLNSKL